MPNVTKLHALYGHATQRWQIVKMITLPLEGISGMEEEGLCDGEEAQKGLNYYVLKVNL